MGTRRNDDPRTVREVALPTALLDVARVTRKANIPLIEDDVYGDLTFGERRPATCKSYDGSDEVIYCSSFSKTIAPGYRVESHTEKPV